MAAQVAKLWGRWAATQNLPYRKLCFTAALTSCMAVKVRIFETLMIDRYLICVNVQHMVRQFQSKSLSYYIRI